jgi:iron complex outermembrane receptor protein
VNNTMGKRSAAAFKLKPTMAFAGQATAGALVALAATGSVYAQAQAAAAPGPAAAASAPETQQVLVTGIRRGIEAAISVKKNSDQIVEAISSEDIGKLPDTTIAESLARLPGVTAQRDKNGNATNVSIRGLGPDFNGYLLNGREQTSTGDSRASDLSVYPVELLSGATVYKTADSTLMTAGLAGTIDNKLIDPLMMPKRVFAVSGTKTETGRGLPGALGHGSQYSLNYVDQFANRTIGVAIGYVHKSGLTNSVGSGNWGGADHQVFDASGKNLGKPDAASPTGYDSINVPGFGNGIKVYNTHQRDKRDGVAAVLEFRPNDRFRSEVDIFHAKIITALKTSYMQVPLGGRDITNATLDANGHVISGTFNLGANPGGMIDDNERVFDNDTLQSFGWRNEVKLGDTWHVSGDLSHNSAKRVERDVEYYAGLTSADTLSFTSDGNGNLKGLTAGNPSAYLDPSQIVIRDQSGWSNTGSAGSPGYVPQDGYYKGPTTVDKIDAARLDFTHDLQDGAFSALQFGANLTTRTKDRANFDAFINSSTNGGYDPIAFPSGSYVEHNVGGTGLNLLAFDPGLDVISGAKLLSNYNNDILSKSWNVREQVTTAYGKLDIDSEVAHIPLRGNLGLQYVFTDQRSSGYRADIGGGATTVNPASTLSSAGTTYSNVLPSLNLVADLGNDNLLRFGAGIQIARNTLTDLRNSFTLSYDQTAVNPTVPSGHGALSGSGGNPDLRPFKAKALDVSYEKYFANKEGYLSGALFYKHLDSYIISKTDTDYDFTQAAQALGITPGNGSYIGTYTRSVNGSGGNLKGVELTAQLPFSMLTHYLEGFGVNASWSDTTSSVRAPNTIGLNPITPANAGTIGLPGLSHINKKLMMYYERAGFSAFIAENMRSRYVGPVTNTQVGGYPTLEYIESQKWISAQVGYEVQDGWLKGLAVRLEGNNLNKPIYRESNFDGSNHVTNNTGATADLMVSYKF